MMINLTKPFSFLLTVYIAAVIIFMFNYITNVYIINALLIGLFGFYIITERKNLKFNPLITAFALFAVFALASSLWAISFDAASHGSLQLFFITINLIVLYNLMINFKLISSFTNGILIGSFVNYVLIMGIIPAPFETMLSWRYMGTTGNPNDLATIMLISMFVSIIYTMNDHNKKNWFFYYQYVNLFFAMYTIFLTVSKKGILLGSSLFLFYIAIMLKNNKDIVRIVISSIFILSIFYFFMDMEQLNYYFERMMGRFDAFSSEIGGESRFGTTGTRKRLAEFGLLTFQDKALLGYGLGSFVLLSETGHYAHNNFLELLVSVGLIGFSLFYYIYFYLFTLIYKMPKSELKTLIIFIMIIFLVMDITTVSYYFKLKLYLLLFFSVYISNIIKPEPTKHEREN